MKKSAAAGIAALAFLALFRADGATAIEPSSETVRLSVGASKTIALSENPSTGYHWQINKGQSVHLAIVQVSDAGYEAGSSHRIGAPGTHRWRIKALATGSARIVFDYARSWEHGAPARRHTVQVEIGAGG